MHASSRTTFIVGTAAIFPVGKTLANINISNSQAISITTGGGSAGSSPGSTCVTTTGKATTASTHLSRVGSKDKQECGKHERNQRNISFLPLLGGGGGGGGAGECRFFVHHDNVVVVSVRFVSDPFRFVILFRLRFDFVSTYCSLKSLFFIFSEFTFHV